MTQDELYDKAVNDDIPLGIVGPGAGTKEGVLVYVPSVADRKFRIRPLKGGAARLSKTGVAKLYNSGCIDWKDGTGDEFRKYCEQEGISLDADAPQPVRQTAGPDLPDDERYRKVALQPADIPMGIVDADAASDLGSWAKEGVLVYAPNRAERKFLIRPFAGGGASALTKIRTAQLGESGHVDFADGTGEEFRKYCAEDNIPLSAAVPTAAPVPEPEPVEAVAEESAPEPEPVEPMTDEVIPEPEILEDDIDRTLSPADQPIDDMTQGQLRKLAADAGIPNRANMGKDELLAALSAVGYGTAVRMDATPAATEPVAVDFDIDDTPAGDFLVPEDGQAQDAFVGFGTQESETSDAPVADEDTDKGGAFAGFMPTAGIKENAGLLFNFGETGDEGVSEDEGTGAEMATENPFAIGDEPETAGENPFVIEDEPATTDPFAGMGAPAFEIDDEETPVTMTDPLEHVAETKTPGNPFAIDEEEESESPADSFTTVGGFTNPFAGFGQNEEAPAESGTTRDPFATVETGIEEIEEGVPADLFAGGDTATDEEHTEIFANPFAIGDEVEDDTPVPVLDDIEVDIPANPFAIDEEVETGEKEAFSPIDMFQPSDGKQEHAPADPFATMGGFAESFASGDESALGEDEGDEVFVPIADDETEESTSPFGFDTDDSPVDVEDTEEETVDPFAGYKELGSELSSDDEYDKVAAAYVESVTGGDEAAEEEEEPEQDIEFPQIPNFGLTDDESHGNEAWNPLDFAAPATAAIDALPEDERFEAAVEEAEQVVSDIPTATDDEGDISWPEFGETPQVDFATMPSAFPGFDMTPADDEETVNDSEDIFSSFDNQDESTGEYEPVPVAEDEVDDAEATVTFGPTFAEMGQSTTETESVPVADEEPVALSEHDPSLADTNPIDRSQVAGAAAAAVGGIAAGFAASKLAGGDDGASAGYQGEDAVRIDLLDDESGESQAEQPVRGVTPEDRKDMRGTYVKTLVAIIILLAIAGAAVAYLVHGGAPLLPFLG